MIFLGKEVRLYHDTKTRLLRPRGVLAWDHRYDQSSQRVQMDVNALAKTSTEVYYVSETLNAAATSVGL